MSVDGAIICAAEYSELDGHRVLVFKAYTTTRGRSSCKFHDLHQLVKHNTDLGGLAFYRLVAAKVSELDALSSQCVKYATKPFDVGFRAKYKAVNEELIAKEAALDEWLRMWAVKTEYSECGKDSSGRAVYAGDEKVVARRNDAMELLEREMAAQASRAWRDPSRAQPRPKQPNRASSYSGHASSGSSSASANSSHSSTASSASSHGAALRQRRGGGVASRGIPNRVDPPYT